MKAYTNSNVETRRVLGAKAGKQMTLKPEQGQLLADLIRRKDRGNDGLGKPEIIDVIQQIKPGGCSRKAARDAFDRTVKKAYSDVLTGRVKVQATTTKRSIRA